MTHKRKIFHAICIKPIAYFPFLKMHVYKYSIKYTKMMNNPAMRIMYYEFFIKDEPGYLLPKLRPVNFHKHFKKLKVQGT